MSVLLGVTVVMAVSMLPSVWPYTTAPGPTAPYTGPPPGLSPCVVTHTTGTYSLPPNTAKAIWDATNTTCEGFFCDGNTGTASMEFALSANCETGCGDVNGPTNYCRCLSGCSAPVPPPSCEIGWTEHEGACYKFFSGRKTFADAESKCGRTLNSKVAPAKTRKERNLVRGMANTTIWIGGDNRNSTDFVWPDGSLVKDGFTAWKSGEPNGKSGTLSDVHCMLMNKAGKWMDFTCTQRKKKFVCKYVLPSP